MVKQVFSVFDKKAKAYTQPFFMNQKGEALRAFDGIVADKQTQIAKYPEDFALYKLGEFDDVSGLLSSLNEPEFIAHAVDFVKEEPKGELAHV